MQGAQEHEMEEVQKDLAVLPDGVLELRAQTLVKTGIDKTQSEIDGGEVKTDTSIA